MVELPKIEPIVDEYRLHRLACRGCGATTCGVLPPGVSRGGFGPYLQAVMALFAGAYRLSKRRIQQAAFDLEAASLLCFPPNGTPCDLDVCSDLHTDQSCTASTPSGRQADGTIGTTLRPEDGVPRRIVTKPLVAHDDSALLRRIVGASVEQIDQEARNLTLTNDPRDVLAVRDSITRLLGLRTYG